MGKNLVRRFNNQNITVKLLSPNHLLVLQESQSTLTVDGKDMVLNKDDSYLVLMGKS